MDVGDPLPDIKVLGPDGEPVALRSLSGRVLVVILLRYYG